PGLDAGAPLAGVDRDAAHAVGAQQDRACEAPFEVVRVVAGALRGDFEPALAGEVDDLGNVGGALRVGDRGGPLVDRQVPRQAGLVVAGVARGHDRAIDRRREHAKPGDVLRVLCPEGGLDVARHWVPPSIRSMTSGSSFAAGSRPSYTASR